MRTACFQQQQPAIQTTQRRTVVGLSLWCGLMLGCVLMAGCEERIVRDSRFSAFAKRYTVKEKPREVQQQMTRAPVSDPKLKEFDLAQFAGQLGKYSLQIGYWDDTFRGRGDFRRAAEEQVLKLRREGVEAYFFHGPLRSMVTVHLFGEEDLIRRADGSVRPGPRIAALQERFPHNLANGEPFRLMIFGKQQEDPQPSFVVEMPRPEQVGQSMSAK